jgi:hypothetical protein
LTSASATLSSDLTQLTIDTGVNATYDTVVDVIYDATPGSLVSFPGGAVPSFTKNDIYNLATDGLPNSQYPLSFVITGPVTVTNKVAKGTASVSLNPIDRELVSRYGPVQLITGGTFGITVDNPAGITILGQIVNIVDGAVVCATFVSSQNVQFATDAALDWQTQMIGRIGILLGQIRTIDQSVTLGDRLVSAV